MMPWPDFHFLRPLWLLFLLVSFLPLWPMRAYGRSAWSSVIAPHLLPHLLVKKAPKFSSWSSWLSSFFVVLIAIALAGPTVEKVPSASGLSKAPLVICLELSSHMLSKDIDPSRLKRALYKLEDLLKAYPGGEFALIAFAGDAHFVVPFTDDHTTLLTLAKTLSPDLMPVKGVNLLSALKLIGKNPGYGQPQVLVMTSTNFDEDLEGLKAALKQSRLPVMIWGFATKNGAPAESSDGGFAQSQKGEVVISHLQEEKLRELKAAGAQLIDFSADGRDVNDIISSMSGDGIFLKKEQVFDEWFDLGPYVLGLAMLVFALMLLFGHGHFGFLGLFLLFSSPEAKARSWAELFLNADQRADQALKAGDGKGAALLYRDDLKKGVAFYRAEHYDEAIAHFSKVKTSDGHYNLGNAYAKKAQFKEAIAAYSKALEIDPNNGDAKANKELLEKYLKEQEQQQSPPDSKPSSDEDKKSADQQESSKSEASKDEKKQDQGQPSSDKADGSSTAKKAESSESQNDESKGKDKSQDRKAEAPKKTLAEEQAEEKSSEKAEAKTENAGRLDPSTQHYFDHFDAKSSNNSLYLKRKFFHETRKDQEKK